MVPDNNASEERDQEKMKEEMVAKYQKNSYSIEIGQRAISIAFTAPQLSNMQTMCAETQNSASDDRMEWRKHVRLRV